MQVAVSSVPDQNQVGRDELREVVYFSGGCANKILFVIAIAIAMAAPKRVEKPVT